MKSPEPANALRNSVDVEFLGWSALHFVPADGVGGVGATILAVIGAFRGRCPKFIIFLYAPLIPICGFLFKAVFWVSTRIATPDLLSTILFWSSTAVAGLSALFGIGPALINNIWLLTNGRNPVAEPEPQTQTKISADEEKRRVA